MKYLVLFEELEQETLKQGYPLTFNLPTGESVQVQFDVKREELRPVGEHSDANNRQNQSRMDWLTELFQKEPKREFKAVEFKERNGGWSGLSIDLKRLVNQRVISRRKFGQRHNGAPTYVYQLKRRS